MKRLQFVWPLILLCFPACHRRGGSHHTGNYPPVGENIPYSSLIPIDSANRMISSYLGGINFKVNKEAQRALVFNADSLRRYLEDDRIRNIKFIFAHSMDYTHEHYGERPDSNSHVMTFIIAGFDDEGHYIYKDGEVYENSLPCPVSCPTGEASSDLLPSASQIP